ncbi:MAG: DUF599 domain-containing protein [Deltaproteobacteria bacterium]|nr:DUF599 domain-containing protein [Deltaproteobacteria bacterium]
MTSYDFFALFLFGFLYSSYQVFFLLAPVLGLQTREHIMAKYRVQWVEGIFKNENPLLAVQTMRNLEMVNTFLSSMVLLMMGGVVSVFFNNPEWLKALNGQDYADFLVSNPLPTKLLVLLLVLSISFFNFVISLRITYNMNFSMTVPLRSEEGQTFQLDQVHRQTRYFFVGVRSLYFSTAPLLWVLHVHLFVAASLGAAMFTLRSDLFRYMPPQLYPLRNLKRATVPSASGPARKTKRSPAKKK